ncbi:MAG: TRAP transporter large permease [Tropicimonas sp.]|uniref:TRAP transporter large permease n=1 Tax=Tropicimonas sp. TaxID=2067044 RepID=UPI003A837990
MIDSALLMAVSLVVFLGLGIWVGLALLLSASLVLAFYSTVPLGPLLTQYSVNILTTPDLVALPLFIIMGEFLVRTRLSQQLFSGLAPWAELLPGRLLHVNVIACTIFASISGSSAATTQVVGRMSLTELLRRGYRRDIALGSLAGAGTLGFLIPPSTIMIIYGVLAQQSVLRLFVAGVLPGLMVASLYVGYIMLRATLDPAIAPSSDEVFSKMRLIDRLRASRKLGPVFLLIFCTLGSMYFGIATPSEAAAIGVVGAAAIAWLDGTLTAGVLRDVALGSARTCAMIGLIMVGATVLSITSTILGYPARINGWVATLDLPPGALIAVMLMVYLLLGCFMDGFSMIVTTLPIFLPLAVSAGFDPVWFGIFIIIAVEMSQITPPVGFNLFVINGLTGDRISHIARVTLPFLFLLMAAVFLMVRFPAIATWLPSVLIG